MSTTRCKFRCTETTERVSSIYHDNKSTQIVLQEARFTAVLGGESPENKAFFEATPSGTLVIGTFKPMFESGAYYYLDIINADA